MAMYSNHSRFHEFEDGIKEYNVEEERIQN